MCAALRVSVAMTTYQGERFLAQQLESIAAQTRRPDELVVGDDGSTDTTLAMLEQFAVTAPFPVHLTVNEQRLGTVANLAASASRCDGDVIFLADQDDVWLPDKVETLAACFEDGDALAAFSDADIVGGQGAPRGRRLFDAVEFSAEERERWHQGEGFAILVRHNVVYGATLAIHSSLREVAFPIPDGWWHDSWLALMAAGAGRVAFVDRPLMQYRHHVGNQTTNLKGGTKKKVRMSLRLGTADYRVVASRFRALRERLGDAGPPSVRSHLDGKIKHLEARAAFAERPVRHAGTLVREVVGGRYRSYSSGWRTAARDAMAAAGARQLLRSGRPDR